MRIVTLALGLVLSGCSVGLFKENPLNGCSSQSSGRWCSPSESHIRLVEGVSSVLTSQVMPPNYRR